MHRLLLVVFLPVAAQPLIAKSLYWRALDVIAPLDPTDAFLSLNGRRWSNVSVCVITVRTVANAGHARARLT